MGLIIREAKAHEYSRVGDITVAAFIDGGVSLTSPYLTELHDAAGRAAHSAMLVAVDDGMGRVVGATSFVLPGSPMDDMCLADESEFRMLAVDPDHQGRGAGGGLVNACLARARAAGSRAVVIRVAETAGTARALYERTGFTRIPDRDRVLGHGLRLLGYRLLLVDT